jgi:glycosyltransferase involved in cell wall biosynthesis
MRLTVAIPTYNRNEVLCETLKHLLPQLSDECELLLVDNHSDVPIEDSLRNLLDAYPQVRCHIIRNCVNIGGAANILRCFELCKTQWIWLFGDDDHPTPDAVSIILQHLKEFPDCCYFNFASSNFKRTFRQVAIGRDDFVQKLDDWSNLLFMSVGVFHCPTMLPQLRFGYQLVYSTAPNVALLLSSLGEDRRSVFSEQQIIQHQAPAGWAAVVGLLGKMSLLDLPMNDATRRTLAKKLRSKPSLEATAMILLHRAQSHDTFHNALYQYDQICGRLYYFDCTWFVKLKIAIYRMLVRFHRLAYPLVCAAYPTISRIVGKKHVKFNDLCSPDLYERM